MRLITVISLIRTILYSSAKYLGDLSAILKGRVIVRIFRRIAGKITARGLGGGPEILKYTLLFILLFQTLLFGQDAKSFSIEMLNERDYPMSIDEEGVYQITIDNKT